MPPFPDSSPIALLSAVPLNAVSRTLIGTLSGLTSPLGYAWVDVAVDLTGLVDTTEITLTVDGSFDGTTYRKVPSSLATDSPGVLNAAAWLTTFEGLEASDSVLLRVPNTYKGLRVYAQLGATGTAGSATATAVRGVTPSGSGLLFAAPGSAAVAAGDATTHALLDQVLDELRIANAYQADIKGVAITTDDLEG